MISNAFALAAVSTVGFIIIYKKLPRKVRRYFEKFSLLTDLMAAVAVYALLGGTLTALMAGGFVCLFVSILLHIANNEEDFLYLYDAKDWLFEQLAVAKEALNTYGKAYRAKKNPTPLAEEGVTVEA